MTTDLVENTPGAALVAQGEALYRIDQDNMIRVAIERPRNEEKSLALALKELDLVPEEAASAFYSIPYRDTDERNRRGDGKERMQYVEGPSVKAAYALARRWGNNSVKATVTADDAGGWTLAGVFVDYETGFRLERPFQALKFFRRRDGRTQGYSGKQAEAAFQAAVSKAERNVILAGLPAYLVNAYFDRAKALVAASTKLPDVLKAFKGLNVTQTQLETHVGEPADKWTPEDFATLRGVYTAIRDGAMTVDEAFAPSPAADAPGTAAPPTPAAPPAAPSGVPVVVTPDSLTGGAVTSESGVDPGDAHRRAQDPSETEVMLARSNVLAMMDRLKLSGPERVLLIREHAKVDSLGAASLDGVTAVLDALKKLDESRKAK